MTLIEIVISLAVLILVMVSLSLIFNPLSKREVTEKEKVFAVQKATQLLEEMRAGMSGIETATNSPIRFLDELDDGSGTSEILTTAQGVTDPADALSGNPERKFVRKITVKSVANDALAREVYVRIFKNTIPLVPLAEVMTILKSFQGKYPPTQVFDLFVIAIENAPAWEVTMATMKPSLELVLATLKARNPGLDFRVHWITRLSYGRDPYYRPEINKTSFTHVDGPLNASDWVYTYPGRNKKGWSSNPNDASMADSIFYDSEALKDGKLIVDGTANNPSNPYVFADRFNHAMRYPAEVAEHNLKGGAEPTLRMLLENMKKNPGDYKNAFFANLHGEGLPMPPMRNYSDPAKDAVKFPNIRVVTHPQKIKYNTGDPVRLRVYSYVHPSSFTAVTASGDPLDVVTETVLSTITIRLSVAPSTITVTKIVQNPGVGYYAATATENDDFTLSGNIITLYRSPLRHGPEADATGLDPGDRLYGLEYIPCVIGDPNGDFPDLESGDFTDSLADPKLGPGPDQPKNTARWVIKLGGYSSANEYKVETWIGDTVAAPLPNIKSETYFWMGQDPPHTERYQFIGDPRHMPYSDVKAQDRYNIYFDTINAHGYSFFDSSRPGFAPENLIDPPMKLGTPYDLPRYYQLLRGGLLDNAMIFGHATGFAFHYIMLGGDIGTDWDTGHVFGIAMLRKLYVPGAASNEYSHIDEMTPFLEDNWYDRSGLGTLVDPRGRIHIIVRQEESDANLLKWTSIPWLGELYPDDMFAVGADGAAANGWQTKGNLLIRNPNSFHRANFAKVRTFIQNQLCPGPCYSNPDSMPGYNGSHFPQFMGGPAIINGSPQGDPNAYYSHTYVSGGAPPLGDGRNGTASVTPAGVEAFQGTFHLVFPSTIVAQHPFRIDHKDDVCVEFGDSLFALSTEAPPDWWAKPEYASQRTTTGYLSTYYQHNEFQGSGYCFKTSAAIGVSSGTSSGSPMAIFAMNSCAPQQNFGASQGGQIMIGSMLRGFMEAGMNPPPAPLQQRIRQLPLISISSPTLTDEIPSSGSMPIIWISTWTRWDGERYTSAYPNTVPDDHVSGSDAATLAFNVKYSTNIGRTWMRADDGSATQEGKWENQGIPNNATSYNWSVSGLNPGTYIIRVEAYINDRKKSHYSFHQVRCYKKP